MVKALYNLMSTLRTFTKIYKLIDLEQRYLKGEKRVTGNYEHFHAFIIPNYNESIELLQETISQLAKHKEAKNRYLVYLGMEKWQKDSDLKAIKLL